VFNYLGRKKEFKRKVRHKKVKELQFGGGRQYDVICQRN